MRDLAQRTIRYQTRSPLRQGPSKREANQFPRLGYFWDFSHEVGRRQGERLSNKDRAFENEPNTPQTYTHVLGNGGREPRSGEVILIRMPFEQIMGRISLTTESEAASTGKGINKPTLHPVLISIVKHIKGPGEQNTIELIGFLVKSFPIPATQYDGSRANARRRKTSYYQYLAGIPPQLQPTSESQIEIPSYIKPKAQ